MRRFPAILLLIAVSALGSGALRYVHELAHAAEDARAHAAHAADSHHPGDEPSAPAPHDESNCFVHAQLNLPMLDAGHVPALVCLGLFVAFLTLLPMSVPSCRPALRLDCRGPPARVFFQLI